MVSLRHIAEDVGVSISLVSKVLNDRMGTTGIRPDLEDKIRRRARELKYHKNRSALALLQRRQDVVGVFIHREGRSGSDLVEAHLDGISAESARHGKRQVLGFFQNIGEFANLCRLAHRGVMDGLLVGGITHEDLADQILEIRKSGLPVVTMMKTQIHRQISNVAVDDVAVGRLGTRHLIEAGCRRIAHIRDFASRFDGYRQALADAGISHAERYVFGRTENFGYAKGQEAAEHFIKNRIEIDGLFAQSDEEAVGAMNVFCDAGLRVPDDIRIVGVDNAPYCEFCRVPLTSVSQSGRERGRVAMELLLESIEEKPARAVLVQPELVVRASTGAAAGAKADPAAAKKR
jgi:LacI family transcriptional regulator